MSFGPSLPSDEELIKKLRESALTRRRAEEEIFSRYCYFIKEGQNQYSLSEEECFDAYADSILEMIKNVDTDVFAWRSSIKTYLYRIFNNKCVDLIRKKTTNKSSVHRTSVITDMLFMMEDSAKTIVQRLIEETDHDLLKNKLAEIGDNCKKVLALFAEGYSDKEIATMADYKSADVVKTTRMRCMDRLRKLYNTRVE